MNKGTEKFSFRKVYTEVTIIRPLPYLPLVTLRFLSSPVFLEYHLRLETKKFFYKKGT